MTDSSDLEALAKRFLDLWQEHAAAAAADPALAEAGQRFAETAAAAPATWFALWTQALQAAQHAVPHGRTAAAGPDSPPPGAAAARSPSGGGAVDVDELARRLAALERRVERLEAQRAAAERKRRPRKPVAKPPRRKS